MNLDAAYWENRYQDNKTGWDIGVVSPAIKNWLDKQENKAMQILVPGAGNAHEVEYAHKTGFKNVYLLDFAQTAVANFKERCPSFPETNILCGNFFEIEKTFDVIIEQTFFCALNPELRQDYVKKCNELLNPSGKIIGLMFNFPLTHEGPPFGGDKEHYIDLFATTFKTSINPCHTSIKPREGREFWVEFSKY